MKRNSSKGLAAAGVLALVSAVAGCADDHGVNGGTGGTGGNGGVGDMTCTNFAPSGSTVTVFETGLLCQLTDPLNAALNTCDVLNPANAADRDDETFSEVLYTVGALDPLLGGSVGIIVDLPVVVPSGNVAAFDVEFPGAVLQAALLDEITVTTALNGQVQQTVGGDNALQVDLLGQNVVGGGRGLVGFVNASPYDQVILSLSSTALDADVPGSSLNVYDTCVSAESSGGGGGGGGAGGESPLSLSQLCAIPTLGPQLVSATGGSCDGGGDGGGLPLDPTALCAIPVLGPQIVSGAGSSCDGGGGGGGSPLDPAALCAVPGVGPALAEAAGAMCGGDGGGDSPISPDQLCAIPVLGPQLASAVGGSCDGGGGGGAGLPLDPSALCAIPTLGPTIVGAAGGACEGGGAPEVPVDPGALCSIPGLGPALAGIAGVTCP